MLLIKLIKVIKPNKLTTMKKKLKMKKKKYMNLNIYQTQIMRHQRGRVPAFFTQTLTILQISLAIKNFMILNHHVMRTKKLT